MLRIFIFFPPYAQDTQSNPGSVSFWMANASELLHFLKQDVDTAPASTPAQNSLAEVVQLAFNFLVDCMQAELVQAMPAFLNPNQDDGDEGIDQRPDSQKIF